MAGRFGYGVVGYHVGQDPPIRLTGDLRALSGEPL